MKKLFPLVCAAVVCLVGCSTNKGTHVSVLQEVYQNGYRDGRADATADMEKIILTPEQVKQWESVNKLSGQPLPELRRKLDTARRGTARHGYTVEELEEAIKIKEAVK